MTGARNFLNTYIVDEVTDAIRAGFYQRLQIPLSGGRIY